MLFKKELKEIPPCKFGKKLTKAELKNQILAVAKVAQTERCGEILIVDYYDTSNKKLQARFFADAAGNNHIVYLPTEDRWSTGSIARVLDKATPNRHLSIIDRDGTQRTVSNYLDVFNNDFSGRYFYGINRDIPDVKGATGTIELWLQKKREKNNAKAAERVENMETLYHSFFEKKYRFEEKASRYFKKHFTTIPGKQYMLFGKLNDKGKRYGVCSCCEKRVELQRCRPKKGDQIECPKCGTKASMRDLRYASKISDSVRIGLANRKGDYITFETMDCFRSFSDTGKAVISYDHIYRTVYDIKKKTCKSSSGQHFYWRWTRYTNWAPGQHTILMYPDNLNDVLGDMISYLDIAEISRQYGSKYNLIQLFLNCMTYPCTEYLFKMGFKTIACGEQLPTKVNVKGRTAADVLAVSPDKVKWLAKAEATASELSFVRGIEYPITEEQFVFSRKHDLIGCQGRINRMLPYMSLQKLYNYIEKQSFTFCHQRTFGVKDALICFSDYLAMSEDMGVHLNKQNLFPKYIRIAHDRLVQRHNEILAERREIAHQAALTLTSKRFKQYVKDGYCIVVPHSREDFIREGQELSHCVGTARYYENHVKGSSLIFFIRDAECPDVAKYTAEIRMDSYIVVQCYGYGDSIPPKEVKDFIQGFAKYLKLHPKKEINYAEDLRTEKSA